MDHITHQEPGIRHVFRRPREFVAARYKLFTQHRARRLYKENKAREQLQDVGLNNFDLMKPETFYIAKILHPNEIIMAAICGHIENGASALLVITNTRIIYLNQIPLFTTFEEIGHGVVEGVTIDIGQFDAKVHLLTGVGNFELHNVNLDAAETFIEVAEELAVANSRL